MKEGILLIVGAVVAILGIKVYQVMTTWVPESATSALTFYTKGEKPEAIVQLSPNGVLSLNLPAAYKTWQLQVETEKAQKKKEAK